MPSSHTTADGRRTGRVKRAGKGSHRYVCLPPGGMRLSDMPREKTLGEHVECGAGPVDCVIQHRGRFDADGSLPHPESRTKADAPKMHPTECITCLMRPFCLGYTREGRESQGEYHLGLTGGGAARILRAPMGRGAQETAKGLKWTLLNKLTMYPLQLVYGMVLARLLTPKEMGIVELTSIFFAIAATLKDSGFGGALIRKIDRTEEDCSTVFWFNVVMSFVLSAILFLLAPWFVEYYHQPELLWLTRVSAILMFLSSSGGVHWTLYSARRDFKTPAIIGVSVSLVSLPVCLYLAYRGWGVWALMTQNIVSSLLSLIVVWIVSPWKPRFVFSKKSFKELFGYGSKMAASALLDTGYNNLRTFFIGKVYSPDQLAFYNRGDHLAAVGPQTACGMIGGVTFPILATLQHDNERLKQVYRQYLRLFTMVIVWGSMLVAAMADSWIRLMSGSQWGQAVPYAQILCFSYALYHIQVINLNLLQVKGRSDLFLRLEIIKKLIITVSLAITIPMGVMAICYGSLVVSVICIFINSFYSKELIGMTIWQQLKDYLPLSLLAVACTWIPGTMAEMLPYHYIVKLAIGGLSSLLIYFGILRSTQNEVLRQLLCLLQERCKKPWQAAILNKLGW